MATKTIRTPIATTRYCYLQGEGFVFFPNRDNGESMTPSDRDAFVFENAVYKTELIFEGADAERVRAEIDTAVQELVEGNPSSGADLKHPPYEIREDGSLLVKTKVRVNGKKRDGGAFSRRVVLLDAATGKPFDGEVGSGSRVQVALTTKPWKGFGTVGLALQPKAVLVHEAKQGGDRKSDEEYWGDFFDLNGEPAAGGDGAQASGDF